jgi:hypothetical protein
MYFFSCVVLPQVLIILNIILLFIKVNFTNKNIFANKKIKMIQ